VYKSRCLRCVVEVAGRFFSPRQAVALVNGARSEMQVLENQVYQGTVLGPPLWNRFFPDSSVSVMQPGCSEAKVADDLTAYQLFPGNTSNLEVLECLQWCQQLVHRWGVENQVAFDPAKEQLVVLHKSSPHGTTARVLGALVDPKLLRVEEVERI
jgi:hypothetical protein